MIVTQKVGKVVRIFLPSIWYICSRNSAVMQTDGIESSISIHLAENL